MLMFTVISNASTFYVSTNGGTGTGDTNSPWSMAKANSTLNPGDTAYLRGGKYTTQIAPSRSGTSANVITYMAYQSEVPVITTTDDAIVLSSRNWIVVSGITVSNLTSGNAHFAALHTSTNNTITNCVFAYGGANGPYCGFEFEQNSQSNLLVNCVIHHWGSTTAAQGDMVNFGNDGWPIGGPFNDATCYNVVDGCTLYSAGHSLLNFRSGRNILRRSWLHNEAWSGNLGMRCLLMESANPANSGYTGSNLIESNRIAFAARDYANLTEECVANRSDRNIYRRNYIYNGCWSGIYLGFSSEVSYSYSVYMYQNTFYYNGRLGNGGAAIWLYDHSNPKTVIGNRIVNNILYANNALITYDADGNDSQSTINAWVAAQVIKTNWINGQDPKFVDIPTQYTASSANQPNFALKSNSPCIDQGVFLTTATSSGSNDTNLTVADSGYFFAGCGRLLDGDTIQLQGGPKAVIASISGNTLTLSSPISWTNGQGIALRYFGVRPDFGAFEYGSEIQPVSSLGILSVTP